jgi:CRP/FNR family transcriptional regulator, nitrogen fixation regulation protein
LGQYLRRDLELPYLHNTEAFETKFLYLLHCATSGVSALIVRITTGSQPRPSTFGEFDLTRVSNPMVSLSEFAYKKGTEIHGEKEPADYAYQVKIGAVRSYQLLSGGRRQIGAFHLVGDIFGLTNHETHRFTAEAIVDTSLWLIKKQSLEVMAKTDNVLMRNLLSVVTRDLQHAEDHMLLLGRKDALEKVAAFLLEMDNRLTGTSAITLPMSRHDIADYLGLTLETVSRALSRLQRAGVLTFAGGTKREITIRSRNELLLLDRR